VERARAETEQLRHERDAAEQALEAERTRLRERLEELTSRAERAEERIRELERPEPELEPEPLEAAHLLFVRNGARYKLVEREGPAPHVGAAIELERLFAVTKLGRSPLPGDPRRCAYLELT
jgi:hypothetical protein